MTHYSTKEVMLAYEQKRDWEKQFPVSRYIFRPLSFRLAAFLSRFTNSPETVAWYGLAVGLGASWFLLNFRTYGPWPGVAALSLFALLDAVDGNIARVTGNVTIYGRMLDGMLGKIAEGIYLPALACGLYLTPRPGTTPGDLLRVLSGDVPEPASWLLLVTGFTALCAMLYASLIETAYDHMKLIKAPQHAPDVRAKIGSSRFRDNPFYLVFINLHAFNVQVLLLAAAAISGPRWLAIFIHSICAYYVLRLLVVFPYYMRRDSKELR